MTAGKDAGPLRGRVAIITGASRRSGIAAAVTHRLAADGADLFLTSWSPHDAEHPWGADPAGAKSLVEQVLSTGRRVEHLAVDLAEPDGPKHVIEGALTVFGHVDMLVVVHARASEQGLEQLTAEEIDSSYAVNTKATLLLVRHYAAQHDDRRSGGRVVTFTSGQHRGAMPGELPYVASKGAVHQVTASLALELAPRGITVNCIDPGPTDTGWATPEIYAAVAHKSPSGRWGEPDDAARLVAWLVSDEARWITGQVIVSDGGYGLI